MDQWLRTEANYKTSSKRACFLDSYPHEKRWISSLKQRQKNIRKQLVESTASVEVCCILEIFCQYEGLAGRTRKDFTNGFLSLMDGYLTDCGMQCQTVLVKAASTEMGPGTA